MKRITGNISMELESRIRTLSPSAIVGFPSDGTDRVFRLSSLRDYDHHRFESQQLANQKGVPRNVAEQQVRFPYAVHLTHLYETVPDWHSLPTELNPMGSQVSRGEGQLSLTRQEKFAQNFNTLMETAEGEKWLLGIGYQEMGDYDDGYPASAEVYRIIGSEAGLTPEEKFGYREALGRGNDTYGAIQDAVARLALQ